jgi:hypothetical protein
MAKLVANPAAPASMASRTRAAICSISASLAVRSEAAEPITYSRSGVWPT